MQLNSLNSSASSSCNNDYIQGTILINNSGHEELPKIEQNKYILYDTMISIVEGYDSIIEPRVIIILKRFDKI
jgi:hypothetical protein